MAYPVFIHVDVYHDIIQMLDIHIDHKHDIFPISPVELCLNKNDLTPI